MSNKRRGISLIVLVITIIVIVILAVAVILTLANNNPIENAKKAAFQNDLKTMQEEVNLYVDSEYTRLKEYPLVNVSKSQMVNLFPSTKGYENQIKVEDNKIVLIGELSQKEIEWAKELGIRIRNIWNQWSRR